jgi:hypothetical protein
MPRGVADVFQIVVLAAGAQRLLRRRRPRVRPRLASGEHILELDHARVDEQQRRIVGRHQARCAHDGMAVVFEELQELVADLCAFHCGMALAGAPLETAE